MTATQSLTYAQRKFLEGVKEGRKSLLMAALTREKDIENELRVLRAEIEYLTWLK